MKMPAEIFESDLVHAHQHCIRHFDEIRRSQRCGGFNCLDEFEPKDNGNGQTKGKPRFVRVAISFLSLEMLPDSL